MKKFLRSAKRKFLLGKLFKCSTVKYMAVKLYSVIYLSIYPVLMCTHYPKTARALN